MITWLEAILLGIIQGITEWVPISSSGHLVIAQQLLGIDAGVFFDAILHFATAIVVIFMFRREVLQILRALLKLDFKSEYGKWALFIIIATIPVVLAGVFLEEVISLMFSSIKVVGSALLATGIFLFIAERVNKNRKLNFKSTLAMGLAQAFAIIPGISRSGWTIGTGLLYGIDKEKAAKFSFLLAVPALIGAGIFQLAKNAVQVQIAEVGPMIIGTVVTMFVAYLTLRFLLKLIIQRKLWVFGIYCLVVGALLLI